MRPESLHQRRLPVFSPAFDERPMHILTVSQVTRDIKDVLEDTFPAVWIEGEISNLRIVQSGHAYFTLKDAQSQLRTVMFRSALRQIRFTPEAGMQVVVRGQLTVYEPRGDYQLLADTLEPKGVGALQLSFEQLKERLFQEGLFDETRKRPIPAVPQRIGIVTSPTGAAIQDIIRVVHRRRANVHLYLYPVRVQGKEAPAEIVTALAALNRFEPKLDVLIVGRGGGSLEDLWAFNEEAVARAIANSEIPVIAAVGHEIDYTIADFVADLRAPTPSVAAELVATSEEELRQQLTSLVMRAQSVAQQTLRRTRGTLERVVTSRVLREPQRLIEMRQQQIDDLMLQLEKAWQNNAHECARRLQTLNRALIRLNPRTRWQRLRTRLHALPHRLETTLRSRLALRRETLHGLGAMLNSLSPLAVLGRGYSVCRHTVTQRLLTSIATIHPGQHVEVLLGDGQFTCTVDDVLKGEPDRGRSDFRTSLETPRRDRGGAGN
jgi:exodeoxyribonuclease VII large subunit